MVSTIAGSGVKGMVDGQGNNASFYNLWGIDFDQKDGSLYVADNPKIRKISPQGKVQCDGYSTDHFLQEL